MINSCSVGRDLHCDTAGLTISRQIATLIAVGLTCLVAIGCTPQFKRMPNRPLELAFDEEPSDVVVETQELVTPANTLRHEDKALKEAAPEEKVGEQAETLVKPPTERKQVEDLRPSAASPVPQVDAFDVFLTLNDPDLVLSSASQVRTAALTEAIAPTTPKKGLPDSHHVVKAAHAQKKIETPIVRHAPTSLVAQPADKPINAVDVDIAPSPGVFPEDRASSLFTGHPEVRFESATTEDGDIAYVWQSGAFCHRPLYFEQPNVERYGHSIGPLQSALSGAYFFANAAALPYWMVVEHPRACCYYEDYGVDCVGPRQRVLPPAHIGAALAEAAAIMGLILLIP